MSKPSDRPFGGKVVLFGGDFRQILPVIPGATRQEVLHATLTLHICGLSARYWN